MKKLASRVLIEEVVRYSVVVDHDADLSEDRIHDLALQKFVDLGASNADFVGVSDRTCEITGQLPLFQQFLTQLSDGFDKPLLLVDGVLHDSDRWKYEYDKFIGGFILSVDLLLSDSHHYGVTRFTREDMEAARFNPEPDCSWTLPNSFLKCDAMELCFFNKGDACVP